MPNVKRKRARAAARGGRDVPADRRGIRWRLAFERSAWAVVMLVVFLAFSRSARAQFTLPKLLALRSLVPLVLLAWLARIRRGEIAALPRAVWLSLLAFAAWSIVATWFAVDVRTALEGMPGRYNGLFTELILLSLFFVLASTAARGNDIEWLLGAMVVALTPVALLAIARAVGFGAATWPEPRPASTIGNPVSVAALLGLAAPFAGAFLVCATVRWRRALWTCVLAIFLCAIVATLSRGPWVGVAAAGVVMLAATPREPASVRRILLPIGAALLATVVAAAALFPSARAALSTVAARAASAAHVTTDPGLVNRFTYINAAARMLGDHPLVGIGHESFALLYPRYRRVEPEAIGADQLPTMVHDEYLQIAVEGGIPALLAYIALVGSILRLVLRARAAPAVPRRARVVAAAFAASISGYLVQQVSGWPEIPVSVAFWIVLGAAVAYSRALSAEMPSPVSPAWRVTGAACALTAAAASIVLAVGSSRTLRADMRMFDAEHRLVADEWPRIADDVDAAMALVPANAHYEDAAGVLALERLFAVADPAAYSQAVDWLDRAARDNPFDPYALIHRVDLETIAVQKRIVPAGSNRVAPALRRLLDMDPNNATVHESIARLGAAEGHPERALAAIRTAEALRPSHPRYHTLEGDALRSMGDRGAAAVAYRAELSTALLAGDPDWIAAERKLIAVLLEAGQGSVALAECGSAMRVTPTDALLHTLCGFAASGRH